MIHTITITKKDFRKGIYTDNQRCPLALALKRQFPEATDIHVGVDNFLLTHPKYGIISRNFLSCEVSGYHEQLLLEDIICYNACRTKEPEEVIFTFKTAF